MTVDNVWATIELPFRDRQSQLCGVQVMTVADEDGSKVRCRVLTNLGYTCVAVWVFSDFPRTRVLGLAPSVASFEVSAVSAVGDGICPSVVVVCVDTR